MGARFGRLVDRVTELFRNIGPGLSGVMPAMRDGSGTYGTQRMNIKARAADRRERYPTD